MNFGLLQTKPGTALGGRSRSQMHPASPGSPRTQAPSASGKDQDRSILSAVDLSTPSDVSSIPDYDIFSHTESDVWRRRLQAKGLNSPGGDVFAGLDDKNEDDGFGGAAGKVEAFASAQKRSAAGKKAVGRSDSGASTQIHSNVEPTPITFTSDAANNYYRAMQAKGGSSTGGSKTSATKASGKTGNKATGSKVSKSSGKKSGTKAGPTDAERYDARVAAALDVITTPEMIAGYVLALPDERGVDKMDLYAAIVAGLKERRAGKSTMTAGKKSGGTKEKKGAEKRGEEVAATVNALTVESLEEADAASTASSIVTERAAPTATNDDANGNANSSSKGATKRSKETPAQMPVQPQASDDPPLAAYPSPLQSPEEEESGHPDTSDAYAVLDRVGLPEGLKLPTEDGIEHTHLVFEAITASNSAKEVVDPAKKGNVAPLPPSPKDGKKMSRVRSMSPMIFKKKKANSNEAASPGVSPKTRKKLPSVRSMSPLVFIKSSAAAEERSKANKEEGMNPASDESTAATGSTGPSAGSIIAPLPSPKRDTKSKSNRALPPRIPSREVPVVAEPVRRILASSDDEGSVECSVWSATSSNENGDVLELGDEGGTPGGSDGTSEKAVVASTDNEYPRSNRNVGSASPVVQRLDDATPRAANVTGRSLDTTAGGEAVPAMPNGKGPTKKKKKKGALERAKEKYQIKKGTKESDEAPTSKEDGEATVDGVLAAAPSREEDEAPTEARKKDKLRKIMDYRKRASPLPRKKVSQKTLDEWLVAKEKKEKRKKKEAAGATVLTGKGSSDLFTGLSGSTSIKTEMNVGDGKEILINNPLHEPRFNRPVRQIKFDPNCDTSPGNEDLSIPPELENAKKVKIWSEDSQSFEDNENVTDPNKLTSARNMFLCGDVDEMTYHDVADNDMRTENDSLVDRTVGDHTTAAESRDGGRSLTDIFACGVDGQDVSLSDIAYEIRDSARDLQRGVKNSIRNLFGACDITRDGGLEYLHADMATTEDQLRGRRPFKQPSSPPVVKRKGETKKAAPQAKNAKKVTTQAKEKVNPMAKKMTSILRSAEEKQQEDATVNTGGVEVDERGEPPAPQEKKRAPLSLDEKRKLYLNKLKSVSMKHL